MPEFVEWMMGFEAGWTDGASRTQRLKMLGNAVVPQQALLALRLLRPQDDRDGRVGVGGLELSRLREGDVGVGDFIDGRPVDAHAVGDGVHQPIMPSRLAVSSRPIEASA